MIVSLTLVHAGIFGALAVLVAMIHAGMRGEVSLAWMAAALCCACAEVVVLGLGQGSRIELTLVSLLVPVAYLCVGQTVREITGGGPRNWPLIGAVGALLALSLLLVFLGVPFVFQTIPFQLACALALGDSIVRLWRSGHETLLDRALIATLSVIACVFLLRATVYPLLYGQDMLYLQIKETVFERRLLLVSGACSPPAVFMILAKIIGGVIARYRDQSEHDHLTGLLNRHAFEQALRRVPDERGAVIYCDIDHFKRVNDRYGHYAGDEVLRRFAAILSSGGQVVGRLGGEEFALLLPGATLDDAARLAEALRLRFHASTKGTTGGGDALSASFGVAEYADAAGAGDALIRADAALYRAKKAGRNRVILQAACDGGASAPASRVPQIALA